MTCPNEELQALDRTREFMRGLLTHPKMPHKDIKAEALSCLHHYPWQMHVEARYANDVCIHDGPNKYRDRRFCKEHPQTGGSDGE